MHAMNMNSLDPTCVNAKKSTTYAITYVNFTQMKTIFRDILYQSFREKVL